MADSISATDDRYQYKSSAINLNSVIMGKDASQLDMNDFFNLLVAQMTNQDMMNPQSDTEFVAQMAQFTTLQGVQTIIEYQQSNYAVSYVGKNVVIATNDENTNALKTVEGLVTNVTFYDGEPMVVVDGKAYPLYTVMEVMTEGSKSINDTGKDKDKGTEPDDDEIPENAESV